MLLTVAVIMVKPRTTIVTSCSKLTLFQRRGLVDFPTGSLVKTGYQLIERVKTMLANNAQIFKKQHDNYKMYGHYYTTAVMFFWFRGCCC